MCARDDGESIGLFEPLVVSEEASRRPELNDRMLELAQHSAAFTASLPASTADSLAGLVRSMNCYYSNLIEGHNTHPIDIERALREDYSTDLRKRNLQKEARAHIAVQKWIDQGGLGAPPYAPESIVEIHKRFCELLPDDLLFVDNPQTGERVRVIPGEFRQVDVRVGRHVAISPGAVLRFLDRMNEAYSQQGKSGLILASANAHHRLLWVHPFLDGNGRVARLMSYAMLRDVLDTRGLWSEARGLARNEDEYKSHLAACDEPRRGDRDGRGTLSESALAEFTAFFLDICIDQVKFMEKLMHPERLRDRIMIWAEEEMRAGVLPAQSDVVLQAMLFQGELARGQVAKVLAVSERTARRVTSALLKTGAVSSTSTRAPIKLAFPARLADRWLPGLFPGA